MEATSGKDVSSAALLGGRGLVRGEVYSATDDDALVIPENAVVVAGSRAVAKGPGKDWGISLYTPVIVKYRDSKTDTKIQLENLLR